MEEPTDATNESESIATHGVALAPTPLAAYTDPATAMADLEVHLEKLVQQCSGVGTVCAMCQKRLGEVRYEGVFAFDVLPEALKQELKNSFETMVDIYKFVSACSYLSGCPPILSAPGTTDGGSTGLDFDDMGTQCLRDFAEVYEVWTSRGIGDVLSDSVVANADMYGTLSVDIGRDFLSGMGDNIFNDRLKNGIIAWATIVQSHGVQVQSVSKQTILATEMKDLYAMLVLKPQASEREASPALDPADGSPKIQPDFSVTAYWKAFTLLQAFIEQLQLESIQVPVFGGGGELVACPSHQAVACMRITALVSDIVTAFEATRSIFQQAVDSKMAPPVETLSNVVVPVLSSQLKLHCDLYEMMQMRSDIELSAAHRYLPSSIGVIDGFREGIANVAGKFCELVLGYFVEHVSAKVGSVRASAPVYKSTIVGGALDQEMAISMLADKAPAVLALHNDLHQLISAFTEAATNLGIDVPLDKHPLTSACIAVGKSTLVELKDCYRYCQGIGILKNRNSVAGANAACKFIEAHYETFKHLGDAFWAELRSMSVYTADAGKCLQPSPRALKGNSISSSASSSSSGTTLVMGPPAKVEPGTLRPKVETKTEKKVKAEGSPGIPVKKVLKRSGL